MPTSISMDQVGEFIKILVEWGGREMVNKNHYICDAVSGEPITVVINKRKKSMVLPHTEMRHTPGKEETIFMPLVETMGHSAERTWFFTTRNEMVGELLKKCMLKVIDICTECDDDEEVTYDQMSLVHTYVGKLDEKMKQELEKLKPAQLARIVYSGKARTAQLQTDIYDEEKLRDILKWRKKTIEVLKDLFNDLLSTQDVHVDYKYSSAEMLMPQIECFINMLAMFSNALGKYAEALLHVPLFPVELEAHIPNLSKYRKKCAYMVGTTIQTDKKEKENTSFMIGGGTADSSVMIGGQKQLLGGNTPSRIPNTLGYGQMAINNLVNPYRYANTNTQASGMRIGPTSGGVYGKDESSIRIGNSISNNPTQIRWR